MIEQDPGAPRSLPTLRYDAGYPRTDHPEAGIESFRTSAAGASVRSALLKWLATHRSDHRVPQFPPAIWDREAARYLAPSEYQQLANDLVADAPPAPPRPPWTGVRRGRRRWQ